MGCFLGCFGGAKDRRRRNHQRANRPSPQRQRNRVQNVHQQESLVSAEQSVKETNPNLDSELLRNKLEELEQIEQLSLSPKKGTTLNSNITTHEHVPVQPSTDFQPKEALSTDKTKQHDLKISSSPDSISGDDNSVSSGVKSYPSNLKNKSPKGSEQSSPSPKKRVTFNSNVTTYENVSVHESVDFQKDGTLPEDIKTPTQSYLVSEDEDSVTSSVASYPPNHRYHNARDSDDEAEEEYGNSDLDDDDEDYYDDYDEDVDVRIAGQEVWSESVLPAASMESRTGSHSPQAINEEAESPVLDDMFGSKANARDRSNYINSVLNPVGNTTQWKAAKSRVQQQQHLLKPQKENLVTNISFEPTFEQQPSKAAKSDRSKNANQEIAVDASLSTWLSSPEVTPSKKKTNCDGLETFIPGSEESCTKMSFEDRPILGALTVEELRQMSKSASPRKSPCRSPDETPIIGTVGTYWNHLNKGIPNTTSKYREDKKVNWHSTPFEKRLDRAISRGGSEA